jgi:cob(I)alamin adenosyltransferase
MSQLQILIRMEAEVALDKPKLMRVVHLSKIYTRSGDDGFTRLGDGSLIAKTDSRLAAYADVDEANSAIGVAISLAKTEVETQIALELTKIQNRLFDLGADLCTPIKESKLKPSIRAEKTWVTQLESAIDKYNGPLPELNSFVLPGGTNFAAAIHLARTIVRRAERSIYSAIEDYGSGASDEPGKGGINPLCAIYLNRLSDYLFVVARVANLAVSKEVLWEPMQE